MRKTDSLEVGTSTGYRLGLHRLQTAQDHQDHVRLAAQEYLDRQSRTGHSLGMYDKYARWYPADQEYCECCELVRLPSRKYPYNFLIHCRTARHVARLYNVTRGELLAMASTL